MSDQVGELPYNEQELVVLRALSRLFPNIDAALAEIARLSAELTLPKGAIHILSDVHGDDVKLRHVINNASGMLRPMVERIFADRLTQAQIRDFLKLVFYPRETLEFLGPTLDNPEALHSFCIRIFPQLFKMVRTLARRYSIHRVREYFPVEYRELFLEMIYGPLGEPDSAYVAEMVQSMAEHDQAKRLVRLTARLLRDLTIDELIIAGDFWDRGPRGDRVMDYLRRQPNVAFTWGNHDTAWLGACLGQEALVAHVLRISLRYGRLAQLEEGYGITLQPLENLARSVYGDDPAACFVPKGTGLRDSLTMARMQKAAAIMQFKLDGQTIDRNPQYGMQGRKLLHGIDLAAGTIEIDGIRRTLRDTHFPTLDPDRPYELSADERLCMDRTRQSFLSSQPLWDHMRLLVEKGSMYLKRDDHLIFHGCVPVDEQGEFLSLEVDGKPWKGKALFDAIDRVVPRALNNPTDLDRDLMWYLWSGALSPLFGKDRITTLENDLVVEKECHVETKNPYFQLIHEVPFCERILEEFGADPKRGIIVNGHVPVKIEQGESPLKRSGKAITIDGAFSAAYGDHGYTLCLEPERTFLAKHHHFESVEAAVRDGVDIIPEIMVVREWSPPRRTADTERGEQIRRQIKLLDRLAKAYRENRIRPS